MRKLEVLVKFLDGVDALGYKYNGTPAYLMSAEQYALFLSHIYDTDAANFIETSTVELLPNEAGVLSYTIPVGIAGLRYMTQQTIPLFLLQAQAV